MTSTLPAATRCSRACASSTPSGPASRRGRPGPLAAWRRARNALRSRGGPPGGRGPPRPHPPPPAPARSVFFSWRFYLLTAMIPLALVVPGIVLTPSHGDTAGFFTGMAVGACTAIATLAALWFWTARRRG